MFLNFLSNVHTWNNPNDNKFRNLKTQKKNAKLNSHEPVIFILIPAPPYNTHFDESIQVLACLSPPLHTHIKCSDHFPISSLRTVALSRYTIKNSLAAVLLLSIISISFVKKWKVRRKKLNQWSWQALNFDRSWVCFVHLIGRADSGYLDCRAAAATATATMNKWIEL